MNDKQILEHTYFNFVWQICDQIPRFIANSSNRQADHSSEQKIDTLANNESLLLAAKLGISFLLEAYIHARDKPNMLQWIDLLTKLFNSNKQACQWLISFLSTEPENGGGSQICVKLFFKCPNSSIRNMFQRLFLHVINRLLRDEDDKESSHNKEIVEKFIHYFLSLIEKTKSSSMTTNKQQKSGLASLNDTSRPNIRFMSEYFTFLIEFSRSGIEQCLMLIKSGAIIKCSEFYLNSRRPPNKKQDLSNKLAKTMTKSPIKSKHPLKVRHQQQQNQKKKNKRKKKKINSKQDVSDTESINSVCSSSSQLLSTSSSSTASSSAASSSTSSILSSFLSSSSSESDTDSSSSLSDDDNDIEEDDDEDIIPIHDQKSKLKVFEKIITLIAHLVEMNTQYQHSVHHHHHPDSNSNRKLIKAKNQKLNLNFFYKSILDDININNVRNILVSLIRAGACRYSHLSSQEPAVIEKKQQKNHLFTVKFIDMCCKSIKRLQSKNGLSIANSEQDRSMPFWHMLGNYSCGLLEIDHCDRLMQQQQQQNQEHQFKKVASSEDCPKCAECQEIKVNFTEIIIDKLKYLIDATPYYALQWMASVSSFNKPIQQWLLDNMSVWVKPLLVAHKQTNVRFSAANLLANLVPNRVFRDSFNSNRNMLIPFKPATAAAAVQSQQNSRCNEINFDFDSQECKSVVHKIIIFLFSLIDELEQFVQPEKFAKDSSSSSNTAAADSANNKQLTVGNTTNHLVQYFTVLIYFMCGKEEKRLFTSYNQSMDKFWSLIYYPHIANNHVFTNLNKQVAVHFFYQTLLNCSENVAHILSFTSTAMDTVAKNDEQATTSNAISNE